MPATKLKARDAEAAEPDAAGYDEDFYSWTIAQAAALRGGRTGELDIDHLAEEIEDLGKGVFKELRSSYRVILTHMLKWDHQPERRSRSWAGSITQHRLDLDDVLADNPALRRRQDEAIQMAYRWARVRASTEMRRDASTLPEECPYSRDEIVNRRFDWPER